MATLDDLVDVLNKIAAKIDLLTVPDPDMIKVSQKFSAEAMVKQVMELKGLDETAAKALIASWKA